MSLTIRSGEISPELVRHAQQLIKAHPGGLNPDDLQKLTEEAFGDHQFSDTELTFLKALTNKANFNVVSAFDPAKLASGPATLNVDSGKDWRPLLQAAPGLIGELAESHNAGALLEILAQVPAADSQPVLEGLLLQGPAAVAKARAFIEASPDPAATIAKLQTLATTAKDHDVRVAAANLLVNLAESPTAKVKAPAAAAVAKLPADLQAEAAPVRFRDDAVLAQTGISEVLDQAGNIASQVNASIALPAGDGWNRLKPVIGMYKQAKAAMTQLAGVQKQLTGAIVRIDAEIARLQKAGGPGSADQIARLQALRTTLQTRADQALSAQAALAKTLVDAATWFGGEDKFRVTGADGKPTLLPASMYGVDRGELLNLAKQAVDGLPPREAIVAAAGRLGGPGKTLLTTYDGVTAQKPTLAATNDAFVRMNVYYNNMAAARVTILNSATGQVNAKLQGYNTAELFALAAGGKDPARQQAIAKLKAMSGDIKAILADAIKQLRPALAEDSLLAAVKALGDWVDHINWDSADQVKTFQEMVEGKDKKGFNFNDACKLALDKAMTDGKNRKEEKAALGNLANAVQGGVTFDPGKAKTEGFWVGVLYGVQADTDRALGSATALSDGALESETALGASKKEAGAILLPLADTLRDQAEKLGLSLDALKDKADPKDRKMVDVLKKLETILRAQAAYWPEIPDNVQATIDKLQGEVDALIKDMGNSAAVPSLKAIAKQVRGLGPTLCLQFPDGSPRMEGMSYPKLSEAAGKARELAKANPGQVIAVVDRGPFNAGTRYAIVRYDATAWAQKSKQVKGDGGLMAVVTAAPGLTGGKPLAEVSKGSLEDPSGAYAPRPADQQTKPGEYEKCTLLGEPLQKATKVVLDKYDAGLAYYDQFIPAPGMGGEEKEKRLNSLAGALMGYAAGGEKGLREYLVTMMGLPDDVTTSAMAKAIMNLRRDVQQKLQSGDPAGARKLIETFKGGKDMQAIVTAAQTRRTTLAEVRKDIAAMPQSNDPATYPGSLYKLVTRYPALRGEMFRQAGINFPASAPVPPLTNGSGSKVDMAYRMAMDSTALATDIGSTVEAVAILGSTLFLTTVTAGAASPMLAAGVGLVIGAGLGVKDLMAANEELKQTQADVSAGLKGAEDLKGAEIGVTMAGIGSVVQIAGGSIVGPLGQGLQGWKFVAAEVVKGAVLAGLDPRTYQGEPADVVTALVMGGVMGGVAGVAGRKMHWSIEKSASGPIHGPMEIEGPGGKTTKVHATEVSREEMLAKATLEERANLPAGDHVVCFKYEEGGKTRYGFAAADEIKATMNPCETLPTKPSAMAAGGTGSAVAGPGTVMAPEPESFRLAAAPGDSVTFKPGGTLQGSAQVIRLSSSGDQVYVKQPFGGDWKNLEHGKVVVKAANGMTSTYVVEGGHPALGGTALREYGQFDKAALETLAGKAVKQGDQFKLPHTGNVEYRVTAVEKGEVFFERVQPQAITDVTVGAKEITVHPFGAENKPVQLSPNGKGGFDMTAKVPISDVSPTVTSKPSATEIEAWKAKGKPSAVSEWQPWVELPASTGPKGTTTVDYRFLGADPATGLAKLGRPEVLMADIHGRCRIIPEFPAQHVEHTKPGSVITDIHGIQWEVKANQGGHMDLQKVGSPTSTKTVNFLEYGDIMLPGNKMVGIKDLHPGQSVTDNFGKSWQVFEIERGGNKVVQLRRMDVIEVPMDTVMKLQPKGPKALSLDSTTKVLETGNMFSRGLAFIQRWGAGETSDVPRIGKSKVELEAPGGTAKSVTMPLGHNPNAPGTWGLPNVAVKEYTFNLTLADGTKHPVSVQIPADGVKVFNKNGTLVKHYSQAELLERAKLALAEMPQLIAKDVSVIRFNPTEDGVGMAQGSSSNALARAGKGQIDIFPNGLNGETAAAMGADLTTMYQQMIWHEMGHNYATENFQNINANGMFAEAVKLDGSGNVPSPYGGTNLAEDFAETLRLYVASNGGKDGVYDMMNCRQVGPGELRERFPNRFKALDTYFAQHPYEMALLKKDFHKALAAAVLGLAGPGAAAGVKYWLDDEGGEPQPKGEGGKAPTKAFAEDEPEPEPQPKPKVKPKTVLKPVAPAVDN